MLGILANIFIAFLLVCGVAYASVVFWVLVLKIDEKEDEE